MHVPTIAELNQMTPAEVGREFDTMQHDKWLEEQAGRNDTPNAARCCGCFDVKKVT